MNEHLSHNPNDGEGRKAKSENEQSVLSGRRYRRHLGATTFAVESACVGGLWGERSESDGSWTPADEILPSFTAFPDKNV